MAGWHAPTELADLRGAGLLTLDTETKDGRLRADLSLSVITPIAATMIRHDFSRSWAREITTLITKPAWRAVERTPDR